MMSDRSKMTCESQIKSLFLEKPLFFDVLKFNNYERMKKQGKLSISFEKRKKNWYAYHYLT